MKTVLAIGLLFSSLSFAYEDGTYHCGKRENLFESTYTIKTLTVDGISLPHLNITKTYYRNPENPNSQDKTYNIKGVATVFTDENGKETLALGSLTIDLEAGRVNCKK